MADDPDESVGEDSRSDEIDIGELEVSSAGGIGDFWYPTVDDIVEVHDAIIEEDPNGEPGIEDRERIQYAVDHVQHGTFGEKPETLHEKAFDLMRLIASNHWFVDGNKRTALNTTNLFYNLNGYELEYGEDLRSMLKLLAVREDIIDRDVATGYLADQTKIHQLRAKLDLLVKQKVDDFIEVFEAEFGDSGLGTTDEDPGSNPDNHND